MAEPAKPANNRFPSLHTGGIKPEAGGLRSASDETTTEPLSPPSDRARFVRRTRPRTTLRLARRQSPLNPPQPRGIGPEHHSALLFPNAKQARIRPDKELTARGNDCRPNHFVLFGAKVCLMQH